MTQYYDPVPYVLPDDDEPLYVEEDNTPEISIERRAFPEHQSCCIFFYALSRDNCDCDFDLVVRCSPFSVSWSIDEESFQCVGLNEMNLLRWMLQVAEIMIANFAHYWTSYPHEWSLPEAPTGWKVVIS